MSNINLNGNDINTDNGENNTSSEEGEMTIYNNGYDENGKILTREALADLVYAESGFGEEVTGAVLARATKVVGKWTLITDTVDGEKREVYIQTSSLPEGFAKGKRVAFEDGVQCDRVVRVKGGEHIPQAIIVVNGLDIVGDDVDLGIHPVADSADSAFDETDAMAVPEVGEAVVADAEETTDEVASAQPKKKARRGKRGGRRNRGKRGGNAAKADNAAKPANAGKGKKAKRPSTYETLKNAFIDRRFDLPALSGKGYVLELFYVNGKPVLRVETGSYDSADIIVDVLARDEDQETLFAALKPGDFITYIPDPFTPQADSLEINGGEYPLYRIVRGFSLKLEKAASEHEEGEPKAHLPAANLFSKVIVTRNGLVKDEYGRMITFDSAEERRAALRYAGQIVEISGLVDMHNPTSNGSLRIHKVKVNGQALVTNQSRAKRFARRGGAPYRADQRAA